MLVLAASFWFSPRSLPPVEVCSLKRWTGLPCPGCGVTRAICAISHGDFAGAWGFHPFSFPIYALLVMTVCAPVLFRIWPRWEDVVFRSKWSPWATGLSLGVLLLYGFWRMGYVMLYG